MDITSILSSILSLKNTIDLIRKQGVMPYSDITQYKKDAVVTAQGSIWIATKSVPFGNSPSNESKYWTNLNTATNSVIGVSESVSDVVYTFSDGTSQVIAKVPSQVITERYESIGKDGVDGTDGVGVATITQENDIVTITLTDGSKYQLTLPVATPLAPTIISDISWSNDCFVIQLSDNQEFTVPIALPKGDAATITIGEVITIDSSEQASIENIGDEHNAILNMYLPKGSDAVSITSIDQLSEDNIKITLSDNTTYEFALPRGIAGKDADEIEIINKIYELLSTDVGSVEQRLSLSISILREELQGLLDYNADDIEGKLSNSILTAISQLPKVTTEDVQFIVQDMIAQYKQTLESERQEALVELQKFISNY